MTKDAPRVQCVTETGIPGVSLLRVLRGRGNVAWHAHAGHCLGLMDAGVRRLSFPDRLLSAAADEGFFIPAATAHACADSIDAAWRVLSIPRNLLPAPACPLHPLVLTTSHAQSDLAAILHTAETGTLSLERLIDILRPFASEPPSPAQTPLDPLDERLLGALSTLAAARGYTPGSFSRAIRRDSGLTPSVWRLLARIRLARALLDAGHSPAETALDAGFADQAHLTRAFTRLLGMTPGEYSRSRGV